MKEIKINQLIITAFIISWIGVIPPLLKSYGIILPAYLQLLEVFMTIGTLIAALIFVYKSGKWQGIKDLFRQFTKVKAPVSIIALVILLPLLASSFGTTIGLGIADKSWPEAFTFEVIISRVFSIFIMYLIINTEEIAWRGVVFNNWLQKDGFIKACLKLAPIWWLFHIPYFFFKGGHPAGYGIGLFLLMVFSITFIIGWIYYKTNGSLFYAHIFHQLINGFGEAFPVFPIFIGGALAPSWVMVIVLSLVAVFIIYFQWKKESTYLKTKAVSKKSF